MAVLLVLRSLGDHDLGREQQSGHRGGILQRQPRHLGRVQNALLEHVAELAGGGVVTEGALAFLDAVEDHRGVLAGVVDDLAQRLLDRARENADADRLVLIRRLELVEHLLHTDQRDATAGHHALFHRRTGRVQRVLDAGLLLLQLDLGGRADLDQGDTAGELRHALLQLLLVVVGGGFLRLLADRLDARLDVGGLAGAVDDRGVFLFHDDLLRLAQIVDSRLLERQPDLIRNDRAAGESGDVLQHGLAAVAEARSLDAGHLENAADVVDDQRRQRLTLDVLGDHQQRPPGLGHALEQRQQLTDVGNLLVDQQDHRLVELGGLVLLVVDEIRREVAAVELHALDHFQLVLQSRALLDRDHALLADLLHRLGDGVAVAGLVGSVGRDFLHHLRAHVLELVLELDLLRDRHAVLGDGGGAEALIEHGIAALRAHSRLDGVGEDIHAPEHALACVVAESDFFSWHCRDPRLLAFNHGHDVFFAHDHKLITLDLDLGSAVLAEQDLVADLDVERPHMAVLENLALADRYDLSLHRLLGRGIGNHDAARGGTLLFQALHDHAVMKRTNLHG